MISSRVVDLDIDIVHGLPSFTLPVFINITSDSVLNLNRFRALHQRLNLSDDIVESDSIRSENLAQIVVEVYIVSFDRIL